jgi:DNA (cytosine-5)-methyltransferase 1
MAEIAAVPWNGFTAISTFSGCGGSCLGYRMAGFKVAWASEFIPAAAEVYRANHPDTILDTRDIRKVKPAEILAARAEAGRTGSDGWVPALRFVLHRRQAREALGQSQEVLRHRPAHGRPVLRVHPAPGWAEAPKVFVAENVSGLVKGVAKGYFLEILAKLKACGYRVGVKVLDAQWLGVPQARQRTIFIGVREDLGRLPVFPKPLPYRYTLRDALPWIVRGKYGPTWKPADAPSPTVSAHGSYNPVTSHQGLELVEARITGGTGAAFDQKGQAFDPDRPCPTVLGTKPNQFAVEGLDMSRFAIGKEWDRLRPGAIVRTILQPGAPASRRAVPDHLRQPRASRNRQRHAPDREAEAGHRRVEAHLRLPRRLRPDRLLRPAVGAPRPSGPTPNDGGHRHDYPR